jgi:hypothetical protein
MSKRLNEKDVALLRQNGLLNKTEIAYYDDDVIIAEDLVTKTRREVVAGPKVMLEAKQKILLD